MPIGSGSVTAIRIALVSPSGRFEGRAHMAPILPGNLEVHWPEAMGLLAPELVDPDSGEPDYNVAVRVARGGVRS